jgi:hypothetical protein
MKYGFSAVLAALLVWPIAVPSGPQDDQSDDWPREIAVERGTVVLYQPQVDAFSEDSVASRAAVAFIGDGDQEPVFGAVWMTAHLLVDRDARVVEITDVSVARVRFPNASDDDQQALAALLEREIPTWGLSISLDRFLTSLEAAADGRDGAADLNTAPPTLLVRYEPTVLVLIDGEPEWRAVEGTTLERVLNTPYTIVRTSTATHYLHAGGVNWFTTPDMSGEWVFTSDVPADVARMAPPEEAPSEEEGADTPVDDRVPGVVVTTEPAELIVFDGQPEYQPIAGVDLLYVTNTTSDVFRNVEDQQLYLVLSGRWYRGPSTDGPWTYVPADSLPAIFAEIPAESEKGSVRAHVAGTEEALDAVLDAQIPQTAAIRRGAADVDVTYDGDPRFEHIEGTDVYYAVNTGFTVLRIGRKYHLCHEGAWYESLSPNGPWETSVTVPDEVQQIPPSNPHYNVRYVNVYHYTPSVVYVGYYPGYMGWYVYGPTVVWGTGYYYRPWIGPSYYYPRPVTYGFSVRYNPYYGWSFGFGVRYGPVTFGFYSRPSYGGYWGPGGYRPYHPRYGGRYGGNVVINTGDININRGGNNIYNRPANRDRLAERPATTDRRRPAPSRTRENNVYTDRDGNVYRRTQDGWQQRDRDGWRPTPDAGARPSQPGTRDRPGQRPQPSQPSARPQPSQPSARPTPGVPSTRPSSPRPGTLERDFQSRQRGTQRSNNFQRSQPRTAPSRGRRR